MPNITDHVDSIVAIFTSFLPQQITGEKLVVTARKVQEKIAGNANISEEDRKSLCAASEVAVGNISEQTYGKKAELIQEFKEGLKSELSPASGLSM